MNTAGFFGKAGAHVMAIGLDLPAQLDQRRAELRRRHRWDRFAGAAEAGGHHRLPHRRVAAVGTGDLAGLPLRLKPVPVAKPPLEFVALGTTQREQDHKDDLRTMLLHPQRWRSQFSATMSENAETICTPALPSAWMSRARNLEAPANRHRSDSRWLYENT